MKYAFMSFSCPGLTLGEMLTLARELGYDEVEPRTGAAHKHGIELDTDAAARQTIHRTIADSGVAFCCLALPFRYADPTTVAQNIEGTRRAIDLAGDLGCTRLRVFGGSFPQTVDREQATRQVADALSSLAPHARERGVVLCLETHDAWTNPDHVADVLRRVNDPSIGVNWDYWHPVRASGWTIQKSFEVLKPWIGHVHFHDGLARTDQLAQRAIGTGDLDCGLVLRLLKSIDYRGYLSGEWINWEPAEVHLPRELAAMKRHEAMA